MLDELETYIGRRASMHTCRIFYHEEWYMMSTITATPTGTVVQHTDLSEPLAFTVLLYYRVYFCRVYVGREASSLLIFWRIVLHCRL